LWGGFSVNSATLTRFFGLHIILPLVLVALVGVHILFLHATGSSNPIGINRKYLTFHPFWTIKDVLGVLFVLFGLISIVLLLPFLFMDPENFIEAKFMVTPVHIQPEWYFLPAYAVLRSIPKKLGGVIGLLTVFLVFYIKPIFPSKKFFSSKTKKMCF
jgi:ubiquinol-cytochrome c reductase cytochrome b subunit